MRALMSLAAAGWTEATTEAAIKANAHNTTSSRAGVLFHAVGSARGTALRSINTTE
jgi:hypothetical protein